jgi:hypothetical protein
MKSTAPITTALSVTRLTVPLSAKYDGTLRQFEELVPLRRYRAVRAVVDLGSCP